MKAIICLLLLIGLIPGVSALDFSGFVSLEEYVATHPGAAREMLVDGNFGAGGKGWNLPAGYSIVPGAGRNGSPAVVYRRTDPKQYSLLTQSPELKEGQVYRFSGWIKTEHLNGDLHHSGGGGTLCMMYSRGKEYLGGSYPEGFTDDGDWRYLEQDIMVPHGSDRYQFAAYLRKGVTGQVSFDDLSVKEYPYVQIYPVSPSAQAVFMDQSELRLEIMMSSNAMKTFAAKDLRCFFELSRSGELVCRRDAKLDGNRIVLDLSGLSGAYCQLRCVLADAEKKVVLREFSSGVTLLPASGRDSENACWIGEDGTAHVRGGEKFMPLGFFMSNLPRKDVDRIAATGLFNTLLPYMSGSLSLDDDGRYRKENENFETIKNTLDYVHSKKLRVIFSLKDFYPWATRRWGNLGDDREIVVKLVEKFKDHPALLAWYINDEAPIQQLPLLTERRNLINRIDPFHPTLGFMNQFASLPFYAPSLDVMGIDPYPIKNRADRSMEQVTTFVKLANTTGMPLWVAPQIFDVGIYLYSNQPERWKETRSPTEVELRSMCLQAAIFGARGFMFWSYYNLYRPPFKNQADFDRSWADICSVAGLLCELRPLLLSNRPSSPVPVQTLSGTVFARSFKADDGSEREVVLVTGNGPGKSEAVLRLTGKYRSRYGATMREKDGRYRFVGQDISSDVLEKEESN